MWSRNFLISHRKGLTGAVKVSSILFATLILGIFIVNYVLPTFAAHRSDSNVITPGFQACNVLTTYDLTVTQTGGPDPIYNVRVYNKTLTNPFPDQKNFSCGAAPDGWDFKGFFKIGSSSYCEYETDQDPSNTSTIANGESLNFTFSINITNQSVHPFQVSTIDTSAPSGGSTFFSFPNVTVDCTPPLTTKHFDGPQKIDENGVEWIDGVTEINLSAVDQPPHPSGIYNLSWRNTVVRDTYCDGINLDRQDDISCKDAEGSGVWTEIVDETEADVINTIITKEEESCHLLEFYATDDVGNVEPVKKNCFFVDKTPPLLEKDNGQAIKGFDENPPIGGTFHWISSDMPITFTCTDQEPHPSGDEEVCFKVSYDRDPLDLTSVYASKYNTAVGDNGFACVPVNADNQFIFNFNENEDTLHDLEYYCKDAVNKTTDVRLQWYKVDSLPPVIEKEMFGSWLGDCPPTEEGDQCYVADNGKSGVTVWVKDNQTGHPTDVACEYGLWWHTDPVSCGDRPYDVASGRCLVDSGGQGFNESVHFDVVFTEDSTHDLEIFCTDELRNTVEDVETFLVDSTPPNTTKEYGEPSFDYYDWCTELAEEECGYEGPGDCVYNFVQRCLEGSGGQDPAGHWMPVWINSSTPVNLTADDEKVGVANISWRNFVITDPRGQEVCRSAQLCNPEFYSDFVDWEGTPWNTVDGNYTNFTKDEESCHVIEYFATDKLGNEERLNWQCVFVDNTPPEGLKEVGEPNICLDNAGGGGGGGGGGAAPGTSLRNITMSNVSAFTDVGVAFNGTYLFVPAGGTDIRLISPADGSQVGAIQTSPAINLDAMAYDKKRNILWACSNGAPNKLYTMAMDGTTTLIDSTLPGTHFTFCDGLAYDENDPSLDSDDRLWFSPDISATVFLLNLTGDQLDSFPFNISSCGSSGIAVGGSDLYLADNGCDQIFRVNKVSKANLGVFSSPGDRPEDLECDPVTFPGNDAIWVRMFENNLLKAFAIADGTCGIGGQAPVCNLTAVSQQTNITLSCKDPLPHPVDHEIVHWRISFPNGTFSEWFWDEGPVEVNFTEDSIHDLEFFCTDALGNAGELDLEFFAVDTVPPVINKTIVGPHIGDCEHPQEPGQCLIDGVTGIHVEAVDPEPHPSDRVTCDWSYQVLDDDGAQGGEQGLKPPFVISFPEESIHELIIVCRDALGNTVRDREVFTVDKTPPITNKKYVGPFFENETAHWISSQTNVTLSAYDQEPHPSGINATYWRNTIVVDEFCNDAELCYLEAEGRGEWNTYTGPFNKPEESCHLIEFYSVDNVNKTERERVNKQCVFVDNSPPLPNKTVGEPKEVWDGKDANFYNISDRCWVNAEDKLECWKVTTMTPITLDCSDPEPHPVDHETIAFNVELDGDDVTQQYCNNVDGGVFNETGDGFCHVSGDFAPVTFHFTEETEHNLEFYCVDALGNKGPIDEEKFKVEGDAFNITINKKWNLISVPFVLLNDSMEEVWDDIAPNISSVWTYDGAQWFVYTPDGVDNDDLDTMLPGWGYWVLAKNNTVLIIGGSLFSPIITPPDKDIVMGWNLIGYYGNEDEFGNQIFLYDGPDGDGARATCALGSLVNTVLGHPEWNTLVTYWEPDNPNQWKFLDFSDNMDPGAGYWLEIDQDELYSFSTTCPFFD